MSFDAHVLKVLIASPGDTTEERAAVERALHGWNADRSEREQIVLLPRRWETDAVPRLGASAQGVINEQLVDRADIVLALFDTASAWQREPRCRGPRKRSSAPMRPASLYMSGSLKSPSRAAPT